MFNRVEKWYIMKTLIKIDHASLYIKALETMSVNGKHSVNNNNYIYDISW